MVEWDGLENRCRLRSTVGSNPTLSAKNPRLFDGDFLSPCAPIQGMVFESHPLCQNPRYFDRDFFLSPCKEFGSLGFTEKASNTDYTGFTDLHGKDQKCF